MNKKAMSFKILNMALFRLLFITIILFVLYLFSSYLIKTNIDTRDLRDHIIFNRIFYSPNSISYYDNDIDRTYPGIVDLTKFNDTTLTKAFNYSDNKIAIRIELTNLDNNNVYESYLNKEMYQRWSPLTKFDQYDKAIKHRYVLIKDSSIFSKGLLRIDMVVINE